MLKGVMRWAVIWILIFLLDACGSSFYLANENMFYLYDHQGLELTAKLKVFRENEQKTSLIVAIPRDVLKYEKGTNERPLRGALSIQYYLLRNYESIKFVDSSMAVLEDIYSAGGKYVRHRFSLPSGLAPERYLIAVEIYDMIANNKTKRFTTWDHRREMTGHDLLVYSYPDSGLIFENFITLGDTFFISPGKNNYRTLVVKFFHEHRLDPAPPPFVEKEPGPEVDLKQPDSTFNADTGIPLVLDRKGLYFFQAQPGNNYGFPFMVNDGWYPELKKAEHLRESLIYLTSSDEYAKMNAAKNAKKEVDRFWLSIAKNKLKAKKLIKNYYQGVEYANRSFTTFKDGWKTDRGMIYIIFGAPPMVYRDRKGESWIYPESAQFPELRFRFLRTETPFGLQYRLKRSEYFKNIYFQAVESWREGKVAGEG